MAAKHSYDRLNAQRLIETLDAARAQIEARFPGAGLAQVAATLRDVCVDVRRGAADVRRPYLGLRAAILTLMAGSLIGAAGALGFDRMPDFSGGIAADPVDAIQALEALFNAVFLTLAGLVFIMSVEERWKRAKALAVLHRVRSITHVIDMHQLAKDPITIAGDDRFDPDGLIRYLEFCTDLLSIAGKIGALYAQDMRDIVVIDTVNDIETLATNLSRKIWQKIQIARGLVAAPRSAP